MLSIRIGPDLEPAPARLGYRIERRLLPECAEPGTERHATIAQGRQRRARRTIRGTQITRITQRIAAGAMSKRRPHPIEPRIMMIFHHNGTSTYPLLGLKARIFFVDSA